MKAYYPAAARPRPTKGAWLLEAECAGMDPNVFFPGRGESGTEAKAVCGRCPVRKQCLDYAIDHREDLGVWGGKSERQRQRIRQSRTRSLR